MNVLALDLGTKCGWAASFGSGVWNLKPSTHESIGQRYQKLRRELKLIFISHPIDTIVYEEVHAHIGVEAAHVYGGLVAVVQIACIEWGDHYHQVIEYKGIGVGTIKKHGTGNGHASKEDMILAATLKFPATNVLDDNHADALILLDYALNKLKIE